MEEWDDLLQSHSYDSFFNPTPPQVDENRNVWIYEENKQFEDALAELDHSCPNFFMSLASRVPFKTIEQVKNHYQALKDDIDMIKSGLIELPEYNEGRGDLKDVEKGQKSSSIASQYNKKGVPWSEEEHRLFLIGLKRFGKSDWRSISRYCVLTRTPTQIASHAQKYFGRLQTTVPPERRRTSIHDTQIITTTTTTITVTASNQQPKCTNLELVEKPRPPSNSFPYNNMTNFISSSGQETYPYLNYHTSTFPPPITTTTTTVNTTSISNHPFILTNTERTEEPPPHHNSLLTTTASAFSMAEAATMMPSSTTSSSS